MSYMVIKRNSIYVLVIIDGVILSIVGHYNHISSAHRRGETLIKQYQQNECGDFRSDDIPF